jgi:hypothetical protein
LSTSAQPDPLVCNTTPVRYYALVGQFDLLAETVGGTVLVPRQVLDPDEDLHGVPSLLSELGRSEIYWSARSQGDADATENWSRLMGLRSRTDLEVIDLAGEESLAYAELVSPDFARAIGLAGTLGPGEAAVIAIAGARGWDAALDDAPARQALAQRCPGTAVFTTRELLRRAVPDQLTSGEAQLIYDDMRAKGYRGPPSLWG